MKTSKRAALFLYGCLAVAALPAAAHHSFAMFDQTKLLHMDGVVVSKFEWTNPHAFVTVSGMQAGGSGTLYALECSSPNLMSHQGWTYNTIKEGDKVSIDYYPLRNGKPGGMLKTITLPNGQNISAW